MLKPITVKTPRKSPLPRGWWMLPLLLILSISVIVAVQQLPVIRQFFSQASGEPANIQVDTKAVLGPLPRPWRHLAQGGEDHGWRLKPLASQVAALHPEHIRIDHIYDFYDVVGGSPGNLTFNFSKLDLLLDDILSTGAKPYIVLSYMPPAISSGDIVAAPQRWEDWQLTVQKTIEHISGTRKISDVYYEVWNEPDLFGKWHYGGSKNYLTMYTHSAIGASRARGVMPFKLGGPATTGLYENWFRALADHAIKNNLRFDFFSWHRYNYNIDEYRTDMVEIRSWLQDYPHLEPTLELHLTEWGHNSDVNSGYDSSFAAAHTVAGAIEMMNVIEKAFVFEIQDGKDPAGNAAWGRWGMFQHADFGAKAKPRYYGLRLLERLGNERLQLLGKGSWVKGVAARTPEGVIQVVMANYDQKGRNVETVPLTFTNLEPGTYTMKTEFVNGRNQTQELNTETHTLRATVPMPANSVVLVELTRN